MDVTIGEDSKPQGGVPSRKFIYAKVATHAMEAVRVLVEEMTEPTKMSGSRVAAARVILNKCLPDIKAMEITGDEGNEIKLKIVPAEIVGKYLDVSTNDTSPDTGESSK